MTETPWPLLRLFDSSGDELPGDCRPPDGTEWLAIAITPRSGSTAFCSVLERTGLLGRPQEVFNPRGPAEWLLKGLRPASLREYLCIVATECSTGNVVAFKGAWLDVRPLAESGRCEKFLAICRWVRLDRRDIEGQATSLARARRTQVWHRRAGEEPLRAMGSPSAAEIQRELEHLRAERSGWTDFFASRSLLPLEIYYEDIVKDLGTAVESVGALVGRSLPRRYDWADSAYWKLA
jgi:LPS sulfotransferase NodH